MNLAAEHHHYGSTVVDLLITLVLVSLHKNFPYLHLIPVTETSLWLLVSMVSRHDVDGSIFKMKIAKLYSSRTQLHAILFALGGIRERRLTGKSVEIDVGRGISHGVID